MRRLLLIGMTVLIAIVPAAAAGSGPKAGAAVTNGRIAFQGYAGSRFPQIFTVAPSGTDLRQVTRVPAKDPGAENPAWSPDGTTIAFNAAIPNGVNLFTVAPDGSRLTELPLAVGAFNGDPAYSPDGRQISFDQDVGPRRPTVHGIFIANADGTGARRLTTGIRTKRAFDTESQWSPDGSTIAFTRVKNSREAAIFTIRVDGTGIQRLTPYKLDAASPDWSPDGSRIAFNSYWDVHPGKSSNLFTMRPDGTGRRALTHHRGGRQHSFRPSWSPDGTKIVFTRFRPIGRNGRTDLYTMNPDGSGVKRLTHLRFPVTNPDWGTAP